MNVRPPDGNDPDRFTSSNSDQTSSTSNTSDPAQNTSSSSNTSQASSTSNNSTSTSNTPAPTQITGVDPQAYPSAQQIVQNIPSNSNQTTGISSQAQQTSQYTPIHYDPPVELKDGNIQRTSWVWVPPDVTPQNPRSTTQGKAIDQKTRQSVSEGTLDDAGHHIPLWTGVNPGDKNNLSLQNPRTNEQGNWHANEETSRQAMKNRPPGYGFYYGVTVTSRKGEEDRPISWTASSHLENPSTGHTIPISSPTVDYLNPSSPHEGDVTEGNMNAQEARKADQRTFKGIGKQMKEVSPQEREAGQTKWQALKDMQQQKKSGSLTPEQEADLHAKLQSYDLSGSTNSTDPNGTPGGGRTPSGSSHTLSSPEDIINHLGGAEPGATGPPDAFQTSKASILAPNQTEPGTVEPPDQQKATLFTSNQTEPGTTDSQTKQNALQSQDENPNHPSKLSSFYQSTQVSGVNWTANTPSGSLASKTFSGTAGPASGSVTTSALGYDTYAQASAGVQGNKLFAQGQVGADAYLGKVSASGQINLPGGATLSGNGTAMVGAVANASGQVTIDPTHGTVDAGAHADAFAGAQAQGSVSINDGPVGGTAQGYVEAGIGVHADADIGIKDGKINCDFGFGACLGVGGGGNVSFTIDTGQVAHDVGQVANDAEHTISHLASDGSHVAHDIANFFGF